MKKASGIAALLWPMWCVSPASGVAAPPPPAVPPPELSEPIHGYDLRTPYQVWRYWVERQKGPVVQALVDQPEVLPGERPVGSAIFAFTRSGDFGPFMSGDLRLYCRRREPHGFDRNDCHYLYRAAHVPHHAESYGEANPVSRWMRQSFDAERLARHLRGSGFAPNSDWWRSEYWPRMFSVLPPPEPILRQNAVVYRLDSRDCPELAAAVSGLEAQRIDWHIDLIGVGEDNIEAPGPHAIFNSYTFSIVVPGPGGFITISGSSARFEELTRPIWTAISRCERRRRATAPAAR